MKQVPSELDLFASTLDTMVPGEALRVVGGTFPGEDDSAEVVVDLSQIIPVHQIVTEDFQKYPSRQGQLAEEGSRTTLTLERGHARFGHDPGLAITCGKRVGTIGGNVVDVWILNPMTPDVIYFIAKPDGV